MKFISTKSSSSIEIQCYRETNQDQLVFSEHQNAERFQRVQPFNFLDLIVVEIQKYESLQRLQMLDLLDGVVLKVEQSQLVLAF